MYPYQVADFVESAKSQQAWFRPNDPLGGFREGLNNGIINSIPDFLSKKNTNCSDAKAVFGDSSSGIANGGILYNAPLNFWNCAFYPNLTRDFRIGRLGNKNQTFLREVDLNNGTSANITSFLSTCLVAYCENSDSCKTPSCTKSQLVVNGTMLMASSVDACLDEICNNDAMKFSNPDIMGIGAMASYVIQFGIAILGFSSLVICICALRVVLLNNNSRPRPEIVKKVIRIQTVIETLMITLDEFQRAQCCFAIATNIASIVFLRNGPNALTQQDQKAVAIASAAGMTPNTMVLTALIALNEQLSALTFSLSFIAWVFSVHVSFQAQDQEISLEQSPRNRLSPKACGGFSPIHICGLQRSPIALEKFTFVISVCTMTLLLVWYLWTSITRTLKRYKPQCKPIPAPRINIGISMTGNDIQAIKQSLGFRTFLSIFFLFLSGVASTWAFIKTIADHWKTGGVNATWSFGQIISVTVWLPTVLSFFNDCIYGPLKGRSAELPQSLSIVRTVPHDQLPTSTPTPDSVPLAEEISKKDIPNALRVPDKVQYQPEQRQNSQTS